MLLYLMYFEYSTEEMTVTYKKIMIDLKWYHCGIYLKYLLVWLIGVDVLIYYYPSEDGHLLTETCKG
jgi:hypothetical protein